MAYSSDCQYCQRAQCICARAPVPSPGPSFLEDEHLCLMCQSFRCSCDLFPVDEQLPVLSSELLWLGISAEELNDIQCLLDSPERGPAVSWSASPVQPAPPVGTTEWLFARLAKIQAAPPSPHIRGVAQCADVKIWAQQ